MNVRWDAVVDRTRLDVPKAPPLPLRRVNDPGNGDLQVHVQLFGALASVSAERSLELELPNASSLADVLAALCERLGESFAACVFDETGKRRRSCRLFVDGMQAENLQSPLDAAEEPTQIEIILLVAPEGG